MKKFKIILLVIIIIVAAVYFGMKYGILNKREVEKTAKKVLKETEEVTRVSTLILIFLPNRQENPYNLECGLSTLVP